jgi:hypothetical protein
MNKILTLFCVFSLALMVSSCEDVRRPVSSSGVGKVTVKVPVGPDGLTTEQRNIGDRLKKDNEPGSIKHLYVISAYSGQVLIYSTVKGKVTSSGKRLTPSTVIGDTATRNSYFDVDIGGNSFATSEVLQDDGSYGTSDPYLFWWDTKGVYHQHYIQGGQILHISSEPLAVKSVVINMEVSSNAAPTQQAPQEQQAK